jgi:hypothetical protein
MIVEKMINRFEENEGVPNLVRRDKSKVYRGT